MDSNTILTEPRIARLLAPYKIDAPVELTRKISQYIDLLLKWNRRISLTAVTSPEEIVKFHFGESLVAISTGICGKSRLADVGTGAGFPGLAFAIADPGISVTLIESNLKKCAFLNEVLRQLDIKNAAVIGARMESVAPGIAGFDWIAARALGQFDELLTWSRDRLAVNGKVLLWLGENDALRISSRPNWIWSEPTPIPGSERRFILRGSPTASS